MAADYPASIADFLTYVPAAGKAVPFDVLQNVFDEIVAVQTVLGANSGAASFTPTIVSSGGGTPTYSLQVGRYRRLLGMIGFTGRVTLATLGTLAAGTITISGLPVASVNVGGLYSNIAMLWAALTTPAVNMLGFVQPNSAVITVSLVTAAVTSPPGLTKADLSGTSDLIFSGFYPIV